MSRTAKNHFYDLLQQALDNVPRDDSFLLCGDFNARVGSSITQADNEWIGVRGLHGFGEINSSGRYLLEFLTMNNATICNSWFKKRPSLRTTWQHPRSEQWHCIDYIITSQSNSKCENENE